MLMSVFVIIIGCYMAIDWITDIVIFINILSSLFNIAYSIAIDGQLRHHIRSSLLILIVITFPPIFTLLKYILYAGDDDGTIPIPWLNLNGQLGDIVDRADGSDVPFSVGGEMFHAHHAVLAARSPVFKTELLGSMAESAMPCVTLHNIDPATFKALLHFVYMDALLSPTRGGASSTSTTTGFFKSLLMAVDMYALKRLKLMCAQKLWGSVSVETVATTLGYAETYHCPELKSKCLSFLMAESSFKKVAFTDGYFHLRQDFPLIIEEIKKRIES
ncbi:BTB/POZ and MATH domain-containing protein 1 [Oryza sativa Japonica Group]